MDNPITDPLPSERTSNEVSFSDYEESRINEVDDCHYGGIYDDQYCLEMFRRALKEYDQCAQGWLQLHFSAMVLEWMQCHPSRDLACRLHTNECYVTQTFKRFWQTSLLHQEFEFKAMADVLRYLLVSLNGVILDALRSYSEPKEALLLRSVVAKGLHSNEYGSGQEVWKMVQEKLSDARECRLAYLLFHCALKPGEIVRACPQEFSDVREVSRMRRNIIELLAL